MGRAAGDTIITYKGEEMKRRDFYALMLERYPVVKEKTVRGLMTRFGHDTSAVEAYLADRLEDRKAGKSCRACVSVTLYGKTWPSRKVFAATMGVNPDWFRAVMSHRADHARECALAVLTARAGHGKDAGAELVQKAAMELIRENQKRWTEEARGRNAAVKEGVPECPEGAKEAVELFRRGLRCVAEPGVVAKRWNMEAAGEGRWKFRGEELTWIVEPERQRLECWHKGVMVRKWEKGEFRR